MRSMKPLSPTLVAASLLAGLIGPASAFAQENANDKNASTVEQGSAANEQTDESSTVPAGQQDESWYQRQKERKIEALEKGRSSQKKANLYATQPEGKVLPKGLMRIRLPFQFASGSFGYDSDGHKSDMGAKVKASGVGLVLEYGLTDDLSLQFLMPYVTSNEVGINSNKFKKSDTYKTNYNAFIRKFAAGLQEKGLCTDQTACIGLVESGFAPPSDTDITLPTGEVVTVKGGTAFNQFAENQVLTSAKPASGETGIGDIQIGALYEVTNGEGPFHFATGLGVRAPTGKYETVPMAKRTTSRGVYEIGLRTNVDYEIARGFMVAWQHQMEHPLSKGKKKRSGLVDPGELNDAAPVDGIKNSQTMERAGTRSVGFVRFKTALGLLHESLMPYGFRVGWEYDYDNAIRLDGQETSHRSSLNRVSLGVSGDLVPYGIPLRADYEHQIPVSGKNVTVAPTLDIFTVKAFYLF